MSYCGQSLESLRALLFIAEWTVVLATRDMATAGETLCSFLGMPGGETDAAFRGAEDWSRPKYKKVCLDSPEMVLITISIFLIRTAWSFTSTRILINTTTRTKPSS